MWYQRLVGRFRAPLLREEVIDEGKEPQLFLRFKTKNRRWENYLVDHAMCPNPGCPCGVVQLYFYPCDANGNFGSEMFSEFGIDIFKKEISDPEGNLKSEGERDFAERLVRGLSEKDWDLLWCLYSDFKTHMTETCDPQEIDVEFPGEVMDEPSLLIAYKDVLPYRRETHMDVGGQHYWVEDEYCVNPECGCRLVRLTFIDIGKRFRKPKARAFIYLNYDDGIWEEDAICQGIGASRTALLMKELSKQFPHSTWSLRHEKLKIIFRRYMMKHLSRAGQPSADKIGRNIPCPCGSGKKYKKCCMGKAIRHSGTLS